MSSPHSTQYSTPIKDIVSARERNNNNFRNNNFNINIKLISLYYNCQAPYITRNVVHLQTRTIYGAQDRTLFTMALGEAMELQQLLNGALEDSLPSQASIQQHVSM